VPEGAAYETTGGFVMAELGRIPVVGDTVRVPGWEVTVLAMDGMRADRLRFRPVDDGDPDARARDGWDRGRGGAPAPDATPDRSEGGVS